ncbi:MAG TPA: hypothetical protein VKV26_18515 [Dehalococcoidia bacterium]|nr:hypothetical protein [Dehalococcoidia bacterium]
MRRASLITVDCGDASRARIAGTGLDVFEVWHVFQNVEQDFERLRGAFDWLSERQLRSALDFAAEHPREMAGRLAAAAQSEERLARLWREHPSTAPPRR